MTGLRLYRRLLDYVRPYWWAFALAVAGMVVVAAGDLHHGDARHPDRQQFPEAGPVAHPVAAAGGDRRVPVPRPGLVHLRIRDGIHRPSRRVRLAACADRQATAAAYALLRRDARRRHPVEGHVRRAPARVGSVRHDHDRDPQHADDRGKPRLAALHQLEADGDDVLRAADRRRRHPLFQPPAAPDRARRADAHRLDDARARGDDRRPPDRPCVRRRIVRAHARCQGSQRAAHVDDQAVVVECRELAADADAGGDRRRRHHLGCTVAERDRRPGPRHVRVLRRRAADAARADQVAVGRQCGDPARAGGCRKHLRSARS